MYTQYHMYKIRNAIKLILITLHKLVTVEIVQFGLFVFNGHVSYHLSALLYRYLGNFLL